MSISRRGPLLLTEQREEGGFRVSAKEEEAPHREREEEERPRGGK